MKISLSEVRRLIDDQIECGRVPTPLSVCEALLESVDDPDRQDKGKSLDTQVELFLSKLEKQAMVSEARLFEGDDDDSKKGADDIDVEEFAEGVAKLIDNFSNLIEVDSIVLRMAINHLNSRYDSDVVHAFESTMRSQHSLVAGMSKEEREAEDFKAPRAGDAGPL